MSKAEKFISDYTRNCSNELCAVEDRYGKKVISYHEWLTPDQALRAVEIAREEVIEDLSDKAKVSSGLDGFYYGQGYKQAEKDLIENEHEKSWRLDEQLWSGFKDIEEASYQYIYDASNDWAYEIPTWGDVQDAFKAGAQWKEEQMIAKAIDAKLLEGHLIRQKGVTHPLHVGDKVKVIVIKED